MVPGKGRGVTCRSFEASMRWNRPCVTHMAKHVTQSGAQLSSRVTPSSAQV